MELVTVERARWMRGGEYPTVLFRPTDGKMDIFGFYARACGIPEERLRWVALPVELGSADMHLMPILFEKGPSFEGGKPPLIARHSQFSAMVAALNDERGLTEEEREFELTNIFFFEAGVKLIFV